MDIISELGSGKYGTVYKATYEDYGLVAVKEVRLHLGNRRNFKKDELDWINEIAALMKLLPICVPYAVCILDAFIENGWLYIITDYIEGYDLFAWENRDFSSKVLKELVKGLYAIHQIGVAHNDIHGSNIMYDRDYDMYRYIDFGLAIPNPTVADYEKDIKDLANVLNTYYLNFRDIKRVFHRKITPEEDEIYINKEKIKEFTNLMIQDFEEARRIVDTIDINT